MLGLGTLKPLGIRSRNQGAAVTVAIDPKTNTIIIGMKPAVATVEALLNVVFILAALGVFGDVVVVVVVVNVLGCTSG